MLYDCNHLRFCVTDYALYMYLSKIANGIAYLVMFDELKLNASRFAYIIVDKEHLMPAN